MCKQLERVLTQRVVRDGNLAVMFDNSLSVLLRVKLRPGLIRIVCRRVQVVGFEDLYCSLSGIVDEMHKLDTILYCSHLDEDGTYNTSDRY